MENNPKYLFQAFCKLLEISKTRTTSYHPSSNDQVEVFNQVILQMIIAYVSRGVKDGRTSSPHFHGPAFNEKQVKYFWVFSANMLMLGRDVIQPTDLILGLPRPAPQDPPTWVANLRDCDLTVSPYINHSAVYILFWSFEISDNILRNQK